MAYKINIHKFHDYQCEIIVILGFQGLFNDKIDPRI
jgi:hypothetical protein